MLMMLVLVMLMKMVMMVVMMLMVMMLMMMVLLLKKVWIVEAGGPWALMAHGNQSSNAAHTGEKPKYVWFSTSHSRAMLHTGEKPNNLDKGRKAEQIH